MKRIVITSFMIVFFYSCNTNLRYSSFDKQFTQDLSYNQIQVDYIDRILSYHIPEDSTIRLGYINTKGKVIIEPQFQICTDFFDDYANVVKDSIYGYVNIEGKVKLFPEYDEVYWYYDSIGIAKKNMKYGLINRNKVLLTEIIYDQIYLSNEAYFTVRKNGKWIILNAKGKQVISSNVILKGSIVYKNHSIYIDSINGQLKQGLIHVNGKKIIEAKYDRISGYFTNGLMRVKDNKLFGFINYLGEVVIPIEYEGLGYTFNENLIRAKKDGKWGYINIKNQLKIPFMYNDAKAFSEGLAMIKRQSKAGYINAKNEIVIPIELEYTWKGKFKEGLAVFKTKEGKYGYIDKKGNVVIKAIYNSTSAFKKGFGFVKLNDMDGYISREGKVKVPIKFNQIWFIKSGLIRYVN